MEERTTTLEQSLKRIVTFIELSCKYKKFALYFVECSLSVQQKYYIDYLIDQCNRLDIHLFHCDVSREIIKDLRHTVSERLHNQCPDKLPVNMAIIITGLEASILLDSREDQPAVLQVMNMGRERYAESFPFAFIICLSDKMLQKVQLAAPDFWSWRSAEPQRFPVSHDWVSKETEKIISLKPISSWNDGVERVSLLERLLENYDELPSHEEIHKDIQLNKLTFFSRLGDAYRFLEKHQKARKSYEQALKLAKELDESDEWATLLNKLGIVMKEMKETDQALEFFQEYLNAALENNDLIKQGAVLNNMGLIYLDKGETEKAVETLEQALILNKQTSQTMAEADSLGDLGLAWLDKDLDKAIEYLKQSLDISVHFKGGRRSFQKDLMNLGTAYFKKAWFAVAAAYYLTALKAYREDGDLMGKKEALIELARCDLKKSEPIEKDTRALQEIQSLLAKMGLITFSDGVLGPQTLKALKEIDPEEVLLYSSMNAIDYYNQALTITRTTQNSKSEFDVLIELARTHKKQGNFKQALSYYDKALKIAQERSDTKGEFACLRALIKLYSTDEEYKPDKVRGYQQKAKRLCEKLGSLRVEDLHIWLMDYENQADSVLIKDKNYYLCLNMRKGLPEQLQRISSQYSFHRTIEFMYNLVEKEDTLIPETKVRGKTTDVEVPKKYRPLPVKFKTKLPTSESLEPELPITTFPNNSFHYPNNSFHNHQPLDVTVHPLQPKKYELLPEKIHLPEKKEQQKPLEIDVTIEGTGVECEKTKDILKTSFGYGSDVLRFTIMFRELGDSTLSIKCKVNGILFEELLPVKVEKTFLKSKNRPEQRYIRFYPAGYQTEAELDYEPTLDVDAGNCEFYIDKFTKRYAYNMQFFRHWIEAYICVPLQPGELLNVGIWIRYQYGGVVNESFSLGNEIHWNYWVIGSIFHENGMSEALDIQEFAFFIDLRRPNGEIARIWQSRSGENYTLAEVFRNSHTSSFGKGSGEYADESSVVFDTKRSCHMLWSQFEKNEINPVSYVDVSKNESEVDLPSQDSASIFLMKAELTPSTSVPGWYGAAFEVETDGLKEGEQVILSFDDERTVSAKSGQASLLLGSKKKKWFFYLDNIVSGLGNFSIDRRLEEPSNRLVNGRAIYRMNTPFINTLVSNPDSDYKKYLANRAVNYWTSRSKEFLDWKLSQKVRLVWAEFIPATAPFGLYQGVKIFIEVENIAYHKRVFLQIESYSGGYYSEQASYYCSVSNGKEIWHWALNSPTKNPYLQFVIGYEVNGQIYWDDNGGLKYTMDWQHNHAPADW